MERDVFQSNSPEALKSFKTLIGAEGKYATENGKQLFQAAKARYMFNAFLDSFDSAKLIKQNQYSEIQLI